MNVSKIYLHSVLICPVWGSPVLGVPDMRGNGNGRPCGQLQAPASCLRLWVGFPLPSLLCCDALPWGLSEPLSNPCVATCPSPGLPAPSFYFCAGCSGQEVHTEGPRYVVSSNRPINYRSPVPHLCHLVINALCLRAVYRLGCIRPQVW